MHIYIDTATSTPGGGAQQLAEHLPVVRDRHPADAALGLRATLCVCVPVIMLLFLLLLYYFVSVYVYVSVLLLCYCLRLFVFVLSYCSC